MKFTAILFAVALTGALSMPQTEMQAIPPSIENAITVYIGVIAGMNTFDQLPSTIPCIMDTLALQQEISEALVQCKLLTPDSVANCITQFSDAVAAEIRDCGNNAIETWAFFQGLWNDVKNMTFNQQALVRVWTELPVVLQAWNQAS